MFVVHTCTCVCVEFRGQLVGICSRLSWAANPQIMIRRLLLVMNVQPQFMRVPLALITYFHPSLFYVSALGLSNLAFCIPYFPASLVSDWPLASHCPSFSLLSAPPHPSSAQLLATQLLIRPVRCLRLARRSSNTSFHR